MILDIWIAEFAKIKDGENDLNTKNAKKQRIQNFASLRLGEMK